jgi:3-oxo-5-alpha-steroid 4-dehydrogenase 1
MFSSAFYIYLYVMIGVAIIVFIALNFVDAGYGINFSHKWGKAINNKLAWFLMEFPIFISMLIIYLCSDRRTELVPVIILIFFEIHYFQRAFIFPFIIKGKSKMPLGIMFMGIAFNILNSVMQGYWIFFESPDGYYSIEWLCTPQFIIGTILFFVGMIINLHSDYIIRHLRKSDTDTRHYLPQSGLFKYVTSANYFGELIEWLGFAILTWSLSGFVFFLWTFANLVPRARSTHEKYKIKFPEEMANKNLKRIFPFIY